MTHVRIKKYSSIIFWYFGLPIFGIEGLWCIIHHQNIFDHIMLLAIPFILCMPFIILKTQEIEDKFISDQVDEYRKMTTLEFMETGEKLETLPIGKAKSMMREAYKIVYQERFLSKNATSE